MKKTDWIYRLAGLLFILMLAGLAAFMLMQKSSYFSFNEEQAYLQTQPEMNEVGWWKTLLYIHIAGGMLCTVIGIIQLITARKQKYTSWHRMLGKIYFFTVIFIECPTSLVLTYYSVSGYWLGMWAHSRFILLTLFWFFTTYRAYGLALRKKYLEHGCWMIRSYALTFVDISGRLWSVLFTYFIHPDPVDKLLWVLWLSFIGNMLIAELVVYLMKRKVVTNYTN